jgi:hypothetical protein
MRRPLRGTVLVIAVLLGASCSSGEERVEASARVETSGSVSSTAPAPETSTATLLPSTSVTTTAPDPTGTGAEPAPQTPRPSRKPAASPKPASPARRAAVDRLVLRPKANVVVPPVPTDPAELDRFTDRLVAHEVALRSPGTPPAEIAALARAQQAAYRAISARTEVLPRVLQRVPEALRCAVEANVTAGAELRALAGSPRTELPPWQIVTPPPAEELERYYREAEKRYGVPWRFLASVHLVETRMGRIRGTSTAGAQGPMQFLPSTWARYGEGGDINSARDSILAAARYLQAAGAPADMAKALYAYNHSHRYVRAVTLYADQIQAEPRNYAVYYHWQVYYITIKGDVLLEEGYGS